MRSIPAAASAVAARIRTGSTGPDQPSRTQRRHTSWTQNVPARRGPERSWTVATMWLHCTALPLRICQPPHRPAGPQSRHTRCALHRSRTHHSWPASMSSRHRQSPMRGVHCFRAALSVECTHPSSLTTSTLAAHAPSTGCCSRPLWPLKGGCANLLARRRALRWTRRRRTKCTLAVRVEHAAGTDASPQEGGGTHTELENKSAPLQGNCSQTGSIPYGFLP